MKIWTDIALTHAIIGIKQGPRNRSISVFFTPTGIKWMRNLAWGANDIHTLGPFRFSDTIDAE